MIEYNVTTIRSFTVFGAMILLMFCAALFELNAQFTKDKSIQKGMFKEEPTKLETVTGDLYGTLLLPNFRVKYPVVLIISGSGPTNRNGNSPLLNGENNGYKMLAEGLAESGIASLRYDKRGIGESSKAMGKESDLKSDDSINDAILWCKLLRKDKRFSTLTIVGHSEGSLVGMVAAQGKNADGYVSIAGPGRPAGQIILEQVRPQLPPDLLKSTEEIVAMLTAGKVPASVPKELYALFRPSVQPYLMSWFRLDPAIEIAKLSIPVLVIQGTTDIQVTTNDAKSLAKAKSNAKLLLVEGMNHVLKEVPNNMDRQIKSYGDPSLQIAPQLVTETVKFVKKIKRQK